MTNYVLGLLNGALSILSLQLVAICALYCVYQSIKLKMTWRDWLFALPVGMAFAIAIGWEHIGDSLRYLTITIWRQVFGGGDLTEVQYVALVAGTAVAGLGMLDLIYVLTREWFGARVLIFSAASVALYLGVAAVFG